MRQPHNSRTALVFISLVGALGAAIFVVVSRENRLVSRARQLVEVGSYREAIGVLTSGIKEYPRDAKAYYWLGVAWTKRGDCREAKSAFTRATKLRPSLRNDAAQVLQEAGLGNSKEDGGTDATGESESKCAPQDYLQLASEYDPSLLDQEDFFYALYLDTPGDYFDEDKGKEFVNKFPKSDRCPGILQSIAEQRYEAENCDGSRGAYALLVQKYPKSSAAAQAKEKLADWWCEIQRTIECDKKFHSFLTIHKGESLEIHAFGDIRLNTGWGIEHITPNDLKGFLGTSEEALAVFNRSEFLKRRGLGGFSSDPDWYDRYQSAVEEADELKEEEFVVGDNWTGTSEIDGKLWMTIDEMGEFPGSFSLGIRYKP